MIEAIKKNFVEVQRIYGGEINPMVIGVRHIISFYPEPNGTKDLSIINLSDKTCILVKHSFYELKDAFGDLYQYREKEG